MTPIPKTTAVTLPLGSIATPRSWSAPSWRKTMA